MYVILRTYTSINSRTFTVKTPLTVPFSLFSFPLERIISSAVFRCLHIEVNGFWISNMTFNHPSALTAFLICVIQSFALLLAVSHWEALIVSVCVFDGILFVQITQRGSDELNVRQNVSVSSPFVIDKYCEKFRCVARKSSKLCMRLGLMPKPSPQSHENTMSPPTDRLSAEQFTLVNKNLITFANLFAFIWCTCRACRIESDRNELVHLLIYEINKSNA